MKAGSQKLQDDRTSHCWSFGSTDHPSSQSRKISVGVMVDYLPKKASEASKERDITGLDGERVKSTTMKTSSNGKGMIEERAATKKPKQTEVVNQVNSPWVSTKKFYQQGTTSETVLCPDHTSNLPASGRTELDGVKNAGLARSVSLFTTETSVLPSDDNRLKKFSGVTYERKQKDGATKRMQDFTFATAQDVPMPDIEMMKNKTNTTENGKTISLRLRLQEILGPVSSPNDHYSESPTPELGANILSPEHKSDKMGDLQSSDKQEQKSGLKGDALSEPTLGSNKQKQNVDRIGDALPKPRQNSDTIETDSDCPDHRVERPVTRSLTRGRAPTRIIKKTTKNGKSSNDKLKHQEKNITSHIATHGGSSSMLTKKKYERKNSKVKSLNLFNDKGIAEKIKQTTHMSVSPLPAQRASTFGTVHSHSHLSDKERDRDLNPNNDPDNAPLPDVQDNQYKGLDSPGKRDQQEHIVTPSERRKENLGSPSVRRFVDQEDFLQSPTFGVNTPATSSFLSPTPKTDPTGEIPGLSYGKNLDSYGDKQIESSDDSDKPNNSRTRKASSVMKASLMEASSDDNYSVSSEEYLPTSDEFNAKKLKFMLRPANELRNKEINVRLNHTKTSSPSIKGHRESNRIPKSSEHNEVDGLTRALELFALELTKLKSKIKSATTKKSSEILKSVAEDVHLQLQSAETHIQTDMGKLKNLSKLKRKRVETRFEEQQERLQLIYTKFKEQINQHLQDCKSTFEGLEADQKELKGTLEKRKSSHRKRLLQVEESIEIQLNDAQKKITATHEVAREKMAQLKQVLGLFLKDDILT